MRRHSSPTGQLELAAHLFQFYVSMQQIGLELHQITKFVMALFSILEAEKVMSSHHCVNVNLPLFVTPKTEITCFSK